MRREAPSERDTHKIADSATLSLARAKWRSSGLSDDDAKKLKFKELDPKETAELLGDEKYRTDALQIPYFDDHGKLTKFYRVRFLSPLPGFAGLVEKPQRYAQPRGTLNEVYLPPLLTKPWHEVMQDTSIDIHITEGELKSAAACAHDLATIGLGGVDVWRSTKRGLGMLPQLEGIDWQERKVVIIYDSDAATNPNVVRAQRQLAKALAAKGAYITIASLPPTKDGKKQGLDDFLIAEGVDALKIVISEAEPFAEAEALWELNEEVLYVRDPGIVVVRDTGRRINPGAFIAHSYSNRHYLATEATKSGGTVLKKKPLAPKWIAWERRFECEEITYKPGQGRILKGEDHTRDVWNSWGGWGCAPKKGDIDPWKWLLTFLFKDQMASRQWFERWLAYPLQNPGVKMYTSSLIWGREKGTGKTFVAYVMKGIYGKNFVEVTGKDIKGSFNGWQANRQFVYGAEISGQGSDKKLDGDHLKKLITQHDVKINEKFLPEYVIPDTINWLFDSNHCDALFLDDDDRRFFVHEVVGAPADRKFYETLNKALHGDEPNSCKGPLPAAVMYHLLNLDLGDFNPRAHAPHTKAKAAMINDGKSDVAMFCVMLKEDPVRMLKPLGEKLAEEGELFTPAQLLHCYDPDRKGKVSGPGLARILKAHGFHQVNDNVPIRTSLGVHRMWAIRNIDQWRKASQKQIAAHFEKINNGGKY